MLSRMRRILAGVAAALLALPAANAAAETEKELQPYAEAAAGAAARYDALKQKGGEAKCGPDLIERCANAPERTSSIRCFTPRKNACRGASKAGTTFRPSGSCRS